VGLRRGRIDSPQEGNGKNKDMGYYVCNGSATADKQLDIFEVQYTRTRPRTQSIIKQNSGRICRFAETNLGKSRIMLLV